MALKTIHIAGPTLAAALLVAVGSTSPALAQSTVITSPGLSTADMSILRGGYGAPPTMEELQALAAEQHAMQTSQPTPQQPQAPLPQPQQAIAQPAPDPTLGQGVDPISTGSVPQRPAVDLNYAPEPIAPPVDADVSLALRGAYVISASGGDYFQVTATPRLVLTHKGTRSTFGLSTELTLNQVIAGEFLPSSGSLSANYDYKLDNDTALTLGGSLGLSKQSLNDPSLDPTIADTPLTVAGSGSAGLTRRFGKLGLTGSGTITRSLVSDTVLTDGTVQSNAASSYTRYGGGLRASVQLTPILSLFGQGDLSYALYDAASASLGGKADGWSYSLRGGVATDWGSGFSGSASIGYGWRMYDDVAIVGEQALLYAASLAYQPGGDFSASATFGTEFSTPEDATLTATQIEYSASAAVAYQINSLIGLRASLGWSWVDPSNEQSWSAGAGTDVRLSDYVSLSADYAYSYLDDAGSISDSHTISAGVNLNN